MTKKQQDETEQPIRQERQNAQRGRTQKEKAIEKDHTNTNKCRNRAITKETTKSKKRQNKKQQIQKATICNTRQTKNKKQKQHKAKQQENKHNNNKTNICKKKN